MARLARFTQNILIPTAITLAACEAGVQILLNTNTLKIHGVLEHPGISKESFSDYLGKRDPQLGWPSALAHGKLFNKQGFRPSPEALKHKSRPACFAIFGDSQGYGLDVSDEKAWSNILARQSNCNVENYSVPAYGTDQAYLRFKKVRPNVDTVIITFIDDNIRRNLLQFWDLALGPIYLERTKPRFILDDKGRLAQIPLPVNELKQAKALNDWNFGNLFKHETFSPSSPIYKTAFQPSFPYTFSLFKKAISSLATENADASWVRKSPLSSLVDRRLDPQSAISTPGAINLQRAILATFIQDCSARYKRCLILRLQPSFTNPDLEASNPLRLAFENDTYLKAHIVPGEFMARCMHSNLIDQKVNKSNLDRRMPGGHYGPETNKAIGECLAFRLPPLKRTNHQEKSS